MSESQTLEIINDLKTLPSDKIAEARDFIAFLRERYGKPEIIDESDEWSEEDLQDVTIASLNYAEGIEDEVSE